MTGALIAAVGWLAAAGVAWWQLSASRAAARVQRTIEFHAILTTGEVGAARDRLATLMWFVGERIQPGKCFRPSFSELLGTAYSRGNEVAGLTLDRYPSEVAGDEVTSPLQDLYRLLWAFERIETAERHGLIDVPLMKELLDHHVVWWDMLTSKIEVADTRHRASLARLGGAARGRDAGLGIWAADDFVDA